MIFEMVQQNFVGVVILLLLILFIHTNNNFDKKTNKLFMAAALCVLILILEEAWEIRLARETEPRQLRVLLSAVGYTLRPVTAYFLILIINRRTRKWELLIAIPLLINMLIAFSALIGKWAFWYTETNVFARGPLGIAPFITAGIYVVMLLFITLRDCKKGGVTEAFTVSAIVLLTVIATTMESVFQFRAIQSACCGISITFYYLLLHTNQNNRDPLTGALTRRRLYLDAEKYNASITAVISLDLNNLKELNDRYGHIEGDKALITITDVINKCIGKRATLYRTGGDEFMILCYKYSEKKVQDLINQLRQEMGKTQYRCAMGYALYSHSREFDQICHNADNAMYKNKLEMKKGEVTQSEDLIV